MNWFQDNYFDFQLDGEQQLRYCGKRERSIDHTYCHRQATYLLTLVCEGEAVLKTRDGIFSLTRGDFYVMFPESQASYTTPPDTPWSIRWVTVTGTQPETLLPLLGITRRDPVVRAADFEHAEHILEELFRKTMKADVYSKISAMSLLYDLLACVSKQQLVPTEDARVAQAVQYIFRHYAEDITVRKLAERAYLNNNYFSKLFSAQVGVTPQQLLLRTRIEKAKELLTYTDMTVGEIAAAVGFSDPLYFSRAFKRHNGVSPSSFR